MMKRKLMSEAAIANGLLAEETMTGANYRRLYLLPTNRLTAIFAKYGQPRKPQR